MEVDGGNITQNPKNEERSETAADIKKKKTKATTSDVWRYFTKLGPGADDVTTRWNSTYIMLESAIKYRKAFEYLKATDHAYKHCPLVDEWGRDERICEFLYPFYETTNLISGTSYPTSNLYFLQVYHIQCVLMESLRSEDELLRSMGEKMMNKFKYWEKHSVILAFGAILDPRLKISILELMYEEIDAETAKEKVEHVKKKLYKLFEKYDKNSLSTVEAQ
nr:zinc finger BED domain-containing protein RICESLEEPER 2-like [Arachis hypogaea]